MMDGERKNAVIDPGQQATEGLIMTDSDTDDRGCQHLDRPSRRVLWPGVDADPAA